LEALAVLETASQLGDRARLVTGWGKRGLEVEVGHTDRNLTESGLRGESLAERQAKMSFWITAVLVADIGRN
jgi:hypothetical protein